VRASALRRPLLRVEESAELVAPREDVWSFASDPYRLADWWPGIAGVRADRLGLAPGARWQVQGPERAGLVRRGRAEGLLLVRRVEPPALLSFHLTAEQLDVELRLEVAGARRTRASLSLAGRPLALRRTLARDALRRLYDLCQTGSGE